MKIFIGLRRILPYLGLLDFNHSNGPLISKILRICIPTSTIISIVFTAWFICFEGESFVEYSRALLGMSFFVEVLFAYAIIAITRQSFFRLYDVIETKIDERKWNILYRIHWTNIENWTLTINRRSQGNAYNLRWHQWIPWEILP